MNEFLQSSLALSALAVGAAAIVWVALSAFRTSRWESFAKDTMSDVAREMISALRLSAPVTDPELFAIRRAAEIATLKGEIRALENPPELKAVLLGAPANSRPRDAGPSTFSGERTSVV